MSKYERTFPQDDGCNRCKQLTVDEYVAERMGIVKSARALLKELDLPEEYEPDPMDVINVAEFLAGDRVAE